MRLLANAIGVFVLALAAIVCVAVAVSIAYSTRTMWPAIAGAVVICGGFALAAGGFAGKRVRRERGPAPIDHGLRRVELTDPYRDVHL
jgi:hypothetical protein